MNETDNQTKMYLLSNVFKIAVGCLMLTLASCGTAKLSVMSFNVRQSHAKEVNPNDSWDNRKEACLEMLQTGKRFFYFNTHLGLTWKSQVEGVNMIVGKMKELNPEGIPLRT
jgi:endonuclease/exonuclease/phosphatase family metal-dependent hydrolase